MNIEKNIMHLTEKSLEQPGAEKKISNYGPITFSHKKWLKYIQIRLAS